MEGFLEATGSLILRDPVNLKQTYQAVASACRGECAVCRDSTTNFQDFTLIPGDVYIVGLFDVHQQGSTPYLCGDINDKHGLPLLEAFNFAIEYVNNKTGMFRNTLEGVQLGGVGLDMCKSASRAANLVANIHSGDTVLAKNGETINPRRIDAYVATMDTESSVRVADVLNELAMPQISYGATGLELLNPDKYSYFLRSVPADDKQARALISYLKKFNFNNIQVIYSFDEIGEPGFAEFEKLAFVNKICIDEKYLVGEGGEVTVAEADQVIRSLEAAAFPTNGEPPSQVVVLWMKDPLPVLEAASNAVRVAQNVLFVATDKWGADPNYLQMDSLKNLLLNRNLVTFDVETADIPAFDEYLEHKTPETYKSNPWFQEYFEFTQGCSWRSDVGGQRCDESQTLPRNDQYVQDPYVLYVINSVFSAAMAIDDALNTLCNENDYGVCDLYRISGERRQRVRDGLLKVNFTDDTHQPFFYTSDGQSDRGFHIYNVTQDAGEFSYMNVGSYNDTDFLKLDITYKSTYAAQCDAEKTDANTADDCKCPFKPEMPSRYMKKAEGGRGLTLVYVGDIHQRDPNNKLACGPINTGTDLQKLLAFFYAISLVNENSGSTLQDSIRLDGLALDSCSHGLRLGQDMYNVLSGNRLCDSDDNGQLVSPSSIVGVVVDKDHNAMPLNDMLAQHSITSISPTAMRTDSNNPYVHPYFLRTRNDDSELARMILGIAREANWNYISVIHSSNARDSSAADAVMANSRASDVCVAESVALRQDATVQDAIFVLEQVAQQVGAKGVVLFVEQHHFRLILEAVQVAGMHGAFTFVVINDWAGTDDIISGLWHELDGSFLIQTRSATLSAFNHYLADITYTNRKGIPDDWFLEIYQDLFQCTLIEPDVISSRQYPRICTKDETVDVASVTQDPAVLHVIISVLATAQGLNSIPQCISTNLDIAACLQLQADRMDLIYNNIANVDFRVLPDLLGNQSFQFSFDANGNGQAGFIISNFRHLDEAERADRAEGYGVFKIGDYTTSGLTLDLNSFGGSSYLDQGSIMTSSCAVGSTCTCRLPGRGTWNFSPSPILDASNVRVGRTYRDPKTGEAVTVTGVPGTTDRFDKVWAIILTVLAATGAFLSLVMFVYLLVMYPTRGGTTILGYVLSFGIVLLYLMVIPFIAHADDQICGLRRFGLGLVYAIVYSSLLVKLVDCWRVRGKGDSYSVKYSKLGRPAGLFMVTVFLVLVQVMISAEWLILRPPTMERVFYESEFWPRCAAESDYDEGLVLSVIYIMALIMLNLLLCLCTFTSTNNHRESRWILGIIVVSIPCWVIWCSVAVLGAYSVRDAAVAVGLLVNATVMLLLVPVRKLYLLHKYNVLIEEEEEEDRKSQLEAASQKGTDYNSVYGRQYDNNPQLHDTGSHVGSHRGERVNY